MEKVKKRIILVTIAFKFGVFGNLYQKNKGQNPSCLIFQRLWHNDAITIEKFIELA